jgi:hypothetical protein
MPNASARKSESIFARRDALFLFETRRGAEEAVGKLCCKYGTSRYGTLFVRNAERILYCETYNASVT